MADLVCENNKSSKNVIIDEIIKNIKNLEPQEIDAKYGDGYSLHYDFIVKMIRVRDTGIFQSKFCQKK